MLNHNIFSTQSRDVCMEWHASHQLNSTSITANSCFLFLTRETLLHQRRLFFHQLSRGDIKRPSKGYSLGDLAKAENVPL